MGVCVAGVNVKGEYRLWSPVSQQQCFGTHPSVIGTYKYITLYMIFLYQLTRFELCSISYALCYITGNKELNK